MQLQVEAQQCLNAKEEHHAAAMLQVKAEADASDEHHLHLHTATLQQAREEIARHHTNKDLAKAFRGSCAASRRRMGRTRSSSSRRRRRRKRRRRGGKWEVRHRGMIEEADASSGQYSRRDSFEQYSRHDDFPCQNFRRDDSSEQYSRRDSCE